MNLNEMVVFAKVVQAGSFRAAARELQMPKSTVSRRVAALEERLGARLLQRTTRKLSLTELGDVYLHHCTRIVAEIEEAELAVTKLQAAPRGVLRVSAPLNPGFLGPTITEFLRRYPETRIEMVSTDRVVDLVAEGIDVAIRVGRLADSTLICRALGKGSMLVVASPDYVDRHGAPETPNDLKTHDCLVFAAGQTRTQWQLRSGQTTSNVTVSARIVVNDFGILQQAALTSLGIALLPLQLCLEHIEAGRLVHLLPDWRPPDVPMQAVYPSTRHLSPKLTSFLDLLRAQLSLATWRPGPSIRAPGAST